MTVSEEFVDHYAVLQVLPDCSAKSLEAAYRQLAKMFHPDHPESADSDKFNAVIEAYRVLRNPEQRAAYDLQHGVNCPSAGFEPAQPEQEAENTSAAHDADAHTKILLFLYRRRREHAEDPGVIRVYVQELLNCSDESFNFHVWYLKAKGFIETTEQGTLAITVQGVDHVISASQATIAEKKLFIAQSREAQS